MQELLNCFVEIAPAPRPVHAEEREVIPEEPKFTGFIFKITANIDPNHRSCVAFCKICSGKFVRNAPYLHVRHGKTMRFSSPTQFMAQRKTTIDELGPEILSVCRITEHLRLAIRLPKENNFISVVCRASHRRCSST